MNLKEVIWSKEQYQEFIKYLKSIKEDKYREFSMKLTPTKYEILGIRIPKLRSIAKDIFKGNYQEFLILCGNEYFEEVMIKLLVISLIKDLEELDKYFLDSISLIDNWALCDTFCNSLKVINKHQEYFFQKIDNIIKCKLDYYMRVGFVLLLCYYIEDKYLSLIFHYLDTVSSESYYVNMAKSWLLCEVFVYNQDQTIIYLENNKLDKFTINKAISKIRDSYRVDKEMKDYILRFKK